MPSTRDPTQVVQPGPGRLPAGVVPASALAFSPEGSNAALQAHINNPTGAHASSAISYAGGPNWADGTTNPSTNVLLELNKIISDLAGSTGLTSGTYKIGAPVINNVTITIPAGTLESQILILSEATGIQYVTGTNAWFDATSLANSTTQTAIDTIVNTLANSASGVTTGSAKIGVSTRSIWVGDGTTNPATSVFGALNKIITDLNSTTVGNSGAHRIMSEARANWFDGTTNPSTDTFSAINKIITDLTQNGPGDGPSLIGAAASGTLSASSLRTQVFLLDDRSSKTANQLATNAFQNFIQPGNNLGAIATSTGTVVGSMVSAGWAPEKRLLFASNTTTVFASYDGGYTWALEGATLMTHSDFVANGQTSALAVGSVGGVGSCRPYGSLHNAGSGNSSMPATGTPTVSRVRPDPFQTDTFWVVGIDSTGPVGSVWKVVATNGFSPPTMTQATALGTGSTSALTLVAPGRTTILCSNGSQLYPFSPSSPTVGNAQTSPTASAHIDLFWVDSISRFLLIASTGPSSLEFWLSPSGLTGTWINFSVASLATLYSAPYVGGGTVFTNVISGFPGVTGTNQSIVVIPVRLAAGSVYDLAFTYDGGVTWRIIPDPLAQHQSASPIPAVQRVSVINNRLAAYGFQAAGNIFHALSSRSGNP